MSYVKENIQVEKSIVEAAGINIQTVLTRERGGMHSLLSLIHNTVHR